MSAKLDPETKLLRALSPAELADEAGAAKARTEAIKAEAIRRGLHRAESVNWKIALSPPATSDRTDRTKLLAVLALSEAEYRARFTYPVETGWVMRVAVRKRLREAE